MRVKVNDEVEVSIIDDGYGAQHGLYEVAVFRNGNLWTNCPFINSFADGGDGTVIGWLTWTQVNEFIAWVKEGVLVN